MRIGSFTRGVELSVQHQLDRAFANLENTSQRLATLRRINRASEDPAGLIALEQMQGELVEFKQAGYQAARAAASIHQADSAMAQIGTLLTDIRGHVIQAAGGTLSDEGIAAIQLEVEGALEAIDRIERTIPSLQEAGGLESFRLTAASLGSDDGRLIELGSGGSLDLSSGNLETAARVVKAASSQVVEARVEAAAYEKYVLDSARAVSDSAEENLTSAISLIRDADAAVEMSELFRAEILARSSVMAAVVASRVSAGLMDNLLQSV
jgi:flagellin-like hook-associated protein FlgL